MIKVYQLSYTFGKKAYKEYFLRECDYASKNYSGDDARYYFQVTD